MVDIRRRLKRFNKRMRQNFNRFILKRGVVSRKNLKALFLGGTVLAVAIITLIAATLVRRNDGSKEESFGTAVVDVLGARSANVSLREDGTIEIIVTPSPTPVPTPVPTPKPILHKGLHDERVHELQAALMKLGYMDSDDGTTDYFGPATERGVELFQRQVNFTEALGMTIKEDGWAGDQTLELLYSADAPKYCVKQGMTGEDIAQMQKQLVDMGYLKSADGSYGEKTVAAVKEFQDRNHLVADGITGETTYEMLYSPNAKESKSKAQATRTKANINKMIEVAKSKLGCKYVLGNTGPKTFDCSGLVYYCLKEAGSNRRRLTAAGYSQVDDWEKIKSMSKLKKGDLICFYNDAKTKVGHVGIVVSSGMMIDASSANGKVVRRSFSTTYWRNHFVCGRRPW